MRKLLFALLAIGTLACGSSGTKSQSTTASAPPPAQHEAGQCQMKEMAGAKVSAADTANGIAVEFTTTGDVAALRTHVHKMADMHNGMAMHEGGEMHGGMGSGEMHGGMGSGDMHAMKMVPSKATVEDIDGGARIVLVPNDPAQLADLRTHVREHAAMIAKGECPMMETQPQQSQPTDEHAGHHPAG